MKKMSIAMKSMLIGVLIILPLLAGYTQKLDASKIVVLEIGDMKVMLSQVKHAISQVRANEVKMGVVDTNPDFKIGELTINESMARVYTNNVVRSELIRLKGKELNVRITETELANELKRIKTQMGGNVLFQASLKAKNSNETKYKEELKQTLFEKKVIDTALSYVTVSDNEVAKYYENNPDEFDRVRVQVIYLSDEEDAVAAYNALSRGEDFMTLAKKTSEDRPWTKPGDYSENISRADLEEEYQAAVFSLKSTMISKPVRSMWGYEVYKVLSFFKPTLQEVKEPIRVMLLNKRRIEANSKLFEDLQATYHVKVYPEYLEDRYLKD